MSITKKKQPKRTTTSWLSRRSYPISALIVFLMLFALAGCAGQGGADIPGPTGLSASIITPNSFILSWSQVSTADYYNVYKDGGQYSTDVLATSRPIIGLASGTTYRMTVSYVIGSTESSQSASLNVETL